MDVEFHFYMTYLIAAKAGFGADDAYTIAYASQYVDDNDISFTIDKGEESQYRNYISQTMNILRPKMKLMRVYPLFHFIPGDPMSRWAMRRDGRLHWLNTTPASPCAEKMIDEALATEDHYRIGIACHAYADTWAHQNFVGYFENFNSLKGVLEAGSPDIGHADAGHNPDWPALVWQDQRLLGPAERVDNKARFLDAARHMFKKLRKHTDPTITDQSLESESQDLLNDLDKAIGGRDQDNSEKDSRIKRYQKLSRQPCYGENEIKEYDPDEWFSYAIKEDVSGIRDRRDNYVIRWDPLTDKYTWRDSRRRAETDWYKFEEAVKDHQSTGWDVLFDANFKYVELEAL